MRAFAATTKIECNVILTRIHIKKQYDNKNDYKMMPYFILISTIIKKFTHFCLS